MGILTSYIENGTKLKSLKFGDGKFTSQPFIQTPIPSDSTVVTKPATPLAAYADGVVRGALISVQRSARDVERLTKYMATPSGVQFALKQNLLSRVAVGTETSGFFNEGIYTPLSTLAQAGVGILGIHLNKQGLDPTGLTKLSLKKYGPTIYELNQSDPNKRTDNRLVDLHFMSVEEPSEFDTNVYKYSGGPGSILGIGKTKIKYATNGSGIIPLRTVFNPKGPAKQTLPETRDIFQPVTGLSGIYQTYTGTIFPSVTKSKSSHDWLVDNKTSYSVYKPGTLNEIDSLNAYLTPGYFLQPNGKSGLKPVDNQLSLYYDSNIQERRTLISGSYNSSIDARLKFAGREITDTLNFKSINPLDLSPKIAGYTDYSSDVTINVDKASSDASPAEKYKSLNAQSYSYLANLNKSVGYYHDSQGKLVYDATALNGAYGHKIGPDFRQVNRDVRGFGDKGQLSTYYDYVTEDNDYFTSTGILDNLYYSSTDKRKSRDFGTTHDLITFRIDIINPTHPNNDPEPLTFRAYIDNLSDNYSPDWNSQTYMGRGEKFHKYNSFDRKISLGFTVAAEGAHHRDAMHNQLNQLASSLAPTYTAQGYMAGNIHKLTVGNYISNQYGIINGLTYEIMDESPWDIEKGKQLPMYIKVTGFQFTPIHNFRPEYKYVAPELPLIPGKSSPKFINQA